MRKRWRAAEQQGAGACARHVLLPISTAAINTPQGASTVIAGLQEASKCNYTCS